MSNPAEMAYAPQLIRDIYRAAFVANSAIQRAIRRLDLALKSPDKQDQIEAAYDILCDAGADAEKLVRLTTALPASFFEYTDLVLRESVKKVATDRKKAAKAGSVGAA